MSPLSARRRTTPLLAIGLSSVVLTGCGFEGAASIPLPGGEGNGADAYEFFVEFSDVLDLVPQSAVKVDDVTVGSVSDIELDGYTALVTVSVNGDIEVPANTSASLRQTSLLGEKFVSLDTPPASEAASQPLREGDLISLEDTTRSAEIEEVLGALSLVLNGGSLEQLQVINTEVVNALEGREPEVKSALNQLDAFVGGLDAQKDQIVRALDSLDRLSSTLVTERQTIATALEDIPAGAEVLSAQREDLVEMLTALDRLGDVAVRVIDQTQENTVADLRALQPILAQLNAAGENLPESFELLTTYPFPRTVFDGIRGDYANLFVTLDFSTFLENEGIPDPTGELPELPVPELPIPELPPVPNPPNLPDLPQSPDVGPAVPAPGAQVPEIPAPAPLPTQRGVPVPNLSDSLNPFASSNSSTGLMQLLLGGLS
jgi:phospholipid/cholesterol/gamma-HCH transport system substrate-binding protein